MVFHAVTVDRIQKGFGYYAQNNIKARQIIFFICQAKIKNIKIQKESKTPSSTQIKRLLLLMQNLK